MRSSRKNKETRSVFDVHASEEGRLRIVWNKIFGAKILNLKPKFRVRHPLITVVAMVVAIVLVALGARRLFTKAEVTDFYPTACLGTWQNPQNAQGRPENLDIASSAFDATNSAIFAASSTQIFCGGFLPPDFKPAGNITRVSVTFLWNMSGGSDVTPSAPESVSSSMESTPEGTTAATSAPSALLWQPFATAFAQDVVAAEDTSTPPVDAGPIGAGDVLSSSGPEAASDAGAAPSSTPLGDAGNSSSSSGSETASDTPIILGPPLSVELSPLATSSEEATTTPLVSSTSLEVPVPTPLAPPPPDENFLEVSYSLDGAQWIELAKVSRENWQHLTISLPIASWDDLSKLQMKVSGIPTSLSEMPTVFLDGMFVEAEYEIPPVMIGGGGGPAMNAASTGAIQNTPVIVLPGTNAPLPIGGDANFKANEAPTFDFDLNGLSAPTSTTASSGPDAAPAPTSTAAPSGPSSFLHGTSRAIASALNFFLNILPRGNSAHAQAAAPEGGVLPTAESPVVAEIVDPANQVTGLQPTFVFVGSTLRIILPQPGKQFRPGAYSLKLWVWQNGAVYYTENSFSWGVLAVNFDKSVYPLGDTARIGFAVLDDQGATRCDSAITMEITSPSGKVVNFGTKDKTIVRNPSCGPHTVTNDPDYSASFAAGEIGTYAVHVSATTPNGTREISDKFEAQDSPLFDVERSAPTRIYPPAKYSVSITVKANQDFTGNILETVPSSFDVSDVGSSQKSFSGDGQTITWPVSLKNGDAVTLHYSFQAPNISPELYKLGPLQIGGWQEARQWQIAADAASFTFDASSTKAFSAQTTVTSSLAVGSGSNELFVIEISDATTSPSGVTIDGVAATKAISFIGNSHDIDIWYATGLSNATHNVSTTFGVAATGNLGLSSYFGAAQSNPLDAVATTTISATAVSTTINTNTANDLLVDGMSRGSGNANTVVNAGQVKVYVGAGTTNVNSESYYLATSTQGYKLGWSGAVSPVSLSYGIVAFKPQPTITLANGTNPASTTIGPGANATTSDVFTFVTDAGTSTITGVTTTISTSTGVYQIQITNNSGAIVYGSSTNPSTNTNFISLSSMNVSTTLTTFRILIDDQNATSMPAPPGGMYIVTSTITAWADSKSLNKSGTNTTSSIITIDNQSPGNVTNASGTAGNAQVTLSWTNPGDLDFSSTTVLRATSSISVTPTEGITYATGTAINTTTTVVCVVASSTNNCVDSGLTNGTAYYYKIFAGDNYANYATGTAPSNSPLTPTGGSSLSFSGVSMNGGSAIMLLNPGGTTPISVNATVNDTTGCPAITGGTTTIALYLNTGATPSSTCIASGTPGNSLNCYVANAFTASSTCSGNSVNTTTTFNMYYFARPTDTSTYLGVGWGATIIFRDSSGVTGSTNSATATLNSLLAFNVTTSSINFGNIKPAQVSAVVTTTIQNYGNVSTTIAVYASTTMSLTTSSSTIIVPSAQHYASTTFTYGTNDQALSSSTSPPNVSGFLLVPPTSTSMVQGDIFWALQVPTGTPTGTFSGINFFSAVQQ